LAVQTLKHLERLANKVAAKQHLHVEPMQVAALLLEKAVETLREGCAIAQRTRRSEGAQ